MENYGKIIRFPINVIDDAAVEIGSAENTPASGGGLMKPLHTTVANSIDVNIDSTASLAAIKNFMYVGNPHNINVADNTTPLASPTKFDIFVKTVGENNTIIHSSTPTISPSHRKIEYRIIKGSADDSNQIYITQDADHIYLNTLQFGEPALVSRNNLSLNGGIEQESVRIRIENFFKEGTSNLNSINIPIFHHARFNDAIAKILIRCDENFHPDVSFSLGMESLGITNGVDELIVNSFTPSPSGSPPPSGNLLTYTYGSFFTDKNVYMSAGNIANKSIYIKMTIPVATDRSAILEVGGQLSIVIFYDSSANKQFMIGGDKLDPSVGNPRATDSVWQFNLETNLLSKNIAVCRPRSKSNIIQNSSAALLISGIDEYGMTRTDNEKLVFSTETVQAVPGTLTQLESASASSDTYGYIVGGKMNDDPNPNMIKIRHSDSSYSFIPIGLDERMNPGCALNRYTTSEFAYVFGGHRFEMYDFADDICKINLINNTKSTFAQSAFSKRQSVDVQTDFKKMYMLGGVGQNDVELGTVISLQLSTDTISTEQISLPFNQRLISQSSKFNINKSDLYIAANRCIQKLEINNNLAYVVTEFNELDLSGNMVIASSYSP